METLDEELLTAMASSGNAHHAASPDDAPGIFAKEFEDLVSLVAQNLSVEVRGSEHVQVLGVLNGFPCAQVSGGVQAQLGDAYGGETRRVVFALGKLGALVSAFFAIATFWPRRFWNLDVRAARDEYLAVDPRFAELRILDTEILISKLNDETLARRGRQLKVAMLALGVAALLVGLGSWLH